MTMGKRKSSGERGVIVESLSPSRASVAIIQAGGSGAVASGGHGSSTELLVDSR
jgi:hypothetical protein